ncbi:hypothetical protein CC79DRAFT_1324420 [Sarocladium strictum]
MTDSIESGVATEQVPRLGQAPSLCRLCDIELSGGETFRSHMKSDVHVYNLRLKVAEPDSATSPPTPPRSGSPASHNAASSSNSRRKQHSKTTVEDESEDDDEVSDASEEVELPEFDPGQCLFCPEYLDDLDSNLEHMTTAHGFTVPFQAFLAVDIETIIWYLYFVISGYRECISCGTQRKSAEAAQQHMIAKGHCRIDITGDMGDFYEMPHEDNKVLEQTQKDTSGSVRLPSGKIISNRKHQEPQEPRQRQERANPFLEQLTGGPADPPQPKKTSKSSTSNVPANTNTDVTTRRGEDANRGGRMVRSSEAILAAQLSRLVLAGDRAQMRLEAKKRGKMERKNNKILQKHFKVDAGDSRAGRQFCC